MSRASARVCSTLALAAAVAIVAACQKVNPSQPSSSGTTSVDTALTSSVTAPRPISPPPDMAVPNTSQPVTLVVANALITRNGVGTYTYEVARDAGFAAKVYTKTGVSEGAGGQTSLTIDKLDAGADYFWHVRAEGGGTVGPFSAARKVTIGPAIVIGAPIPIGPLTGTTTAGWPSFTVSNASKAGPVGSTVYLFEISSNVGFTTILLSATVAETPGQTTFTPSGQAPPTAQTSLFWRATARDTASGIAGPASAVQGFVLSAPTRQSQLAAQLGLTLWPGAQPPGTTGRAVMGNNWQVQTLQSFNGVPFVSPALEELQIFDLLDRGMDPNAAINWMVSNGYRTTAAWYPSVLAIGFPYQYMALVNGQWDLVNRVGA